MSDISLTVGGCLMCIFIRNRWSIKEMNDELTIGNPTFMGSPIQKYLNITIGYICPIILGILSVLIIIEKFFGLESLL
jgi:NSS family neurotransmitter:Na+ symporter